MMSRASAHRHLVKFLPAVLCGELSHFESQSRPCSCLKNEHKKSQPWHDQDWILQLHMLNLCIEPSFEPLGLKVEYVPIMTLSCVIFEWTDPKVYLLEFNHRTHQKQTTQKEKKKKERRGKSQSLARLCSRNFGFCFLTFISFDYFPPWQSFSFPRFGTLCLCSPSGCTIAIQSKARHFVNLCASNQKPKRIYLAHP